MSAVQKATVVMERLDVHFWFHLDFGGGAPAKLDSLLASMEGLLMVSLEIKEAMARIDTATTGIATRIEALIAKIGTGMSEADVAEVTVGLKAEATKLEGMATDPENPV